MEPSRTTFRGSVELSEVGLLVKNGVSREKSGETISAQKCIPISHRHFMVEYLPVGSKGVPQTIIGKKIISSPKILNHTPSPLCNVL